MEQIIAVASAYKQSHYFNPLFSELPKPIKEDIRKLVILTAEKTGGLVFLGFYEHTEEHTEKHSEEQTSIEMFLRAEGEANDFAYDEIGAKLIIDRAIREQKELLESCRLWYLCFKQQGQSHGQGKSKP